VHGKNPLDIKESQKIYSFDDEEGELDFLEGSNGAEVKEDVAL
jgi:hypothetical protein